MNSSFRAPWARESLRASARKLALALAAASLLGALAVPARAFDPDKLTPVSVSLQGVNYYSSPVFADAMKMGRTWNRGSNTNDTLLPGELNAVGLPRASSPTEVFKSWYQGTADRDAMNGRYVVTWTGMGNVRLATSANVKFVSGTGNGAGAFDGGRRVYEIINGSRPAIEVTGLTADGLTSLNVWMPHPDDRANTSLEPAERAAYNAAKGLVESSEAYYFNPVLIRVLKERPWNSIRFMDWTDTNNNPTRNWSERRPPGFALQSGGLVSRNPVTGAVPYTETKDGVTKTLYADPGISWEYAIALCNATGKNLWINVPHLAAESIGTSEDYVANLAKVIAYGSDANGRPYASTYTGPKVWQPLASNLEVFVEYSNEVWNGMFAQQKYTDSLDGVVNKDVPKYMAIQSLKVWEAFEKDVPSLKSATVDRVVRLLGCQQVTGSNLKSSLDELYTAGIDGKVGYADAVTTASYFGNSIEIYVRDAILEGDRHPRAHEKDDTQPGGQYPVYTYTDEAAARIDDEAYYNKVFDEWTRRVLVGDTNTGNAFDTTGKVGGIGQDVFDAAAARGLRIVATEGGASIYTDKFDNGSPYDDLLTNFVARFPVKPRMADLMKMHLELGRLRGLRSYNIFTLTGDAAKYGQWGVMDLDSDYETAPRALRYRAIREFFDEFKDIRPAGALASPVGTAPAFTTAEDLGEHRIGSALSFPIGTSNATSLKVVGKILVPGMNISVSGTTATISGKPTQPGTNFVLLRAMDGDKDPAWRIFRFNVKSWSRLMYFNDLPAQTAASITSAGYVLSSGDGGTSLEILPAVGSTSVASHRVRVNAAVPAFLDAVSTSPLNVMPFNFDSIDLGRADAAVAGVRMEALSEAGNVLYSEDLPLTGAVNTLATVTRDNWKNVFTVRLTFYSALTPIPDTKPVKYATVPVAGGLVDNIRLNK